MGTRLADERKLAFKLYHVLHEVMDEIGSAPGRALDAEVTQVMREAKRAGLGSISAEIVRQYEAATDPQLPDPVCECNGGEPCACPDCDCSDCSFQRVDDGGPQATEVGPTAGRQAGGG